MASRALHLGHTHWIVDSDASLRKFSPSLFSGTLTVDTSVNAATAELLSAFAMNRR